MRIVERIVLHAAIVLATGAVAAMAGDHSESGSPAALRAGSTVRVSYVDADPRAGIRGSEDREIANPATATVTGELLHASSDFITVRASREARPVVIPRRCIVRVERKTGEAGKEARALLIGGIGIGVGALVGGSGTSGSSRNSFGPSGSEIAGAGIAVVGIAAALVSLMFDAGRWEEIPQGAAAANGIRLGFGHGFGGQAGVFLSGRF